MPLCRLLQYLYTRLLVPRCYRLQRAILLSVWIRLVYSSTLQRAIARLTAGQATPLIVVGTSKYYKLKAVINSLNKLPRPPRYTQTRNSSSSPRQTQIVTISSYNCVKLALYLEMLAHLVRVRLVKLQQSSQYRLDPASSNSARRRLLIAVQISSLILSAISKSIRAISLQYSFTSTQVLSCFSVQLSSRTQNDLLLLVVTLGILSIVVTTSRRISIRLPVKTVTLQPQRMILLIIRNRQVDY